MEILLEDYRRKLKTIMVEIRKGGNDLTLNRLGTKASCYRTIIGELERQTKKQSPEEILREWENKWNPFYPSQMKWGRDTLVKLIEFAQNK